MQRSVFLLVTALSAATLLGSSGVCSMRPVIRLPRDAETTGRHIVVLKDDTSHQQLLELVDKLEKEGCKVYSYMEVALKAIVLDLSYDALQKVRCAVDGAN